jgi:hypothetical protein
MEVQLRTFLVPGTAQYWYIVRTCKGQVYSQIHSSLNLYRYQQSCGNAPLLVGGNHNALRQESKGESLDQPDTYGVLHR